MLPRLIDDIDYWKNKIISPEEILAWFRIYECGFVHDGNPKSPHVELNSRECSVAYFDCRQLFNKNPRLCAIFANQLVEKLEKARLAGKFNWIIGSSYSAITFSYEVAKILGVSHGFTEKHQTKPEEQIWKGIIPKGCKILQVEELITTLGTTLNVRQTVEKNNYYPVEFLPFVGALIHRPPDLEKDYNDMQVIALVETEIEAVDYPCPLCRAGSARYSPKDNWKRLTKTLY